MKRSKVFHKGFLLLSLLKVFFTIFVQHGTKIILMNWIKMEQKSFEDSYYKIKIVGIFSTIMNIVVFCTVLLQ